MTYCDCCRIRPGTPLQLAKGGQRLPVFATLCRDCATAGHRRDSCLLCETPQPTWHCARVAHFRAVHPDALEKIGNDDFAELKVPKPAQTYLGRLQLPTRRN